MKNLTTVKKIIITGFILAIGAGGFLTRHYWKLRAIGKPIFLSEEYTQTAATILGEHYLQFTHPDYGFSLDYPDELEVLQYKEKEGTETIVFQRRGDSTDLPSGQKTGFQIFISPFGKDEILTKERILQDAPQILINDPVQIIVNPEASEPGRIKGLLFWSESPDIGKTREVWFSRAGHLYEITAYAHLDAWLAKILSTLRFKN